MSDSLFFYLLRGGTSSSWQSVRQLWIRLFRDRVSTLNVSCLLREFILFFTTFGKYLVPLPSTQYRFPTQSLEFLQKYPPEKWVISNRQKGELADYFGESSPGVLTE